MLVLDQSLKAEVLVGAKHDHHQYLNRTDVGQRLHLLALVLEYKVLLLL
jgi:ethanolamine ammonia-lyase small subunit